MYRDQAEPILLSFFCSQLDTLDLFQVSCRENFIAVTMVLPSGRYLKSAEMNLSVPSTDRLPSVYWFVQDILNIVQATPRIKVFAN